MMTESKHRNIPVFIPHLGCPHNCIFCNQKTISGTIRFEKENVRTEIEEALRTIPSDCKKEIAYFGGSFTGIDRSLMIDLLDIAQYYVDKGDVQSIRMSTRPDYIDDEILGILKNYSVKTIELGLQSFDDNVLELCERGHTYEQAKLACLLIKKYGFGLGGQMMIGLPGSSNENEIMTANKICEFGADEARIYPTVVLRNTPLAKLVYSGQYVPVDLKQMIKRGCDALEVFDKNGVNVIRIGLCSSDIRQDDVVNDTFHPAIGEMIESELFLRKIRLYLDNAQYNRESALTVICPKGCTSKIVGQRKSNRQYIKSKYGLSKMIIIENEELIDYNIECQID